MRKKVDRKAHLSNRAAQFRPASLLSDVRANMSAVTKQLFEISTLPVADGVEFNLFSKSVLYGFFTKVPKLTLYSQNIF